MENIGRLEQIPLELLKARNVSFVVINGMMLDKKMLIGKAKRDAFEILQYKNYLSKEGIEHLNTILKL